MGKWQVGFGLLLLGLLNLMACSTLPEPEPVEPTSTRVVTVVVVPIVATRTKSPPLTPTPIPTAAPPTTNRPSATPQPTSELVVAPATTPIGKTATAVPPTNPPTEIAATGEIIPSPTTPPATETAVATTIATAVVVTSLPPPPVGAAQPTIYETSITIPTYNYEAAFLPTTPDDPIYPYPRLDPALVGPPSPRTYRAIVLENGFVAVTILPELGGRIYQWRDKATGRRLLYNNPVIKPTSWGYRGWWLAAGGIEWAFPVDEHGLNEWRPWQVSTGSTAYGLSVTVSDVDDHTGMEAGATISLDAGHAYVTIQPFARNNTAEAHPYQLWLNAMLSLSGNAVSDQTEFIFPANQVTIHSTTDGGVPGSGSPMSWPVYNGRDLSWYSNWNGYLGFFVTAVTHGFSGVYDHAVDQGIIRAYNPGWPAGTKLFGPDGLSPAYWTDDNSNYIELWSGATSSFWSYATLNPGESFSWTEYWYPVHGLGGFNFANRTAALRLNDNGGSAEIGVAVSGGVTGRIILWAGGQEAANWPVTIYPGQAFRATWTRPSSQTGALGLQLLYNDGTVAAQTGLVP
ncbi:MAG: DUF5107 domain-containing protein [Ardenticatenaceae bacterium]|nr:DUF5107 domain-containing protein [Ardenticatenaceae bacterium]